MAAESARRRALAGVGALALVLLAIGCGRKQAVEAPRASAASAASAPAGAPAAQPARRTASSWTREIVEGAPAQAPAEAAHVPVAGGPGTDMPRGLPAPLGTPAGRAREPAWRVRARNY